MKSLTAIIVFLTLTATCGGLLAADEPVALSGNLVGNGGFERAGVEDLPAGWMTRNWLSHPNMAGRQDDRAHFGDRSLLLESSHNNVLFGAYSQPIDVSRWASGQLLLSFYYRTEKIPLPDVSVMTFPEDFTEDEWETPALDHEDRRLRHHSDWRRFSTTIDLLPNARHAIVLFRMHGEGNIWVDGVSMRALPAEIGVEVLSIGVVKSPDTRVTTVRATNNVNAEIEGTVVVEGWESDKRESSADRHFTLEAGESRQISVEYRYDYKKPHLCRLTLFGGQKDIVYFNRDVKVPGLIDAYLAEPAFRNTMLSEIPTPQIIVRGHLHGTQSVRRSTVLRGRMVGATNSSASEAAEILVDEDGRFHASIETPTMVSGEYMIRLNADYDGREMELSIPLSKAPPAGQQVGYDGDGMLYVDGHPVFPTGLAYFYNDEDMDEACQARFNFVISPAKMASRVFMDRAGEVGLGVFVSSANMEKDFWDNMADKYAHRPELWGWYILERPGSRLPGIAPEVLGEVYADIAQADPHHPVLCSMDSEAALRDYHSASDIALAWTHPSPPDDLRPVANLVHKAVQIAADRKPVWTVLPLAGATHIYNQDLDPEGIGRIPTPEEYRAMAYLSVIHGARGIVSYAFRIPGDQSRRSFVVTQDAPDVWDEAARVNRELHTIGPRILRGVPQRKLEPGADAVPYQIWYHRGRVLVILVNTTSNAQVLQLKVPRLADPILHSVNSPQRLESNESGFLVPLEPYEASIYIGQLQGSSSADSDTGD